jgi:YaiO family outer membrane protein
MLSKFFCSFLLLLNSAVALCQKVNGDSLFQVAKTNAFEKNYSKASQQLFLLLKIYPKYDDARLLLARMEAWQRNFKRAEAHTDTLLKEQRQLAEVFSIKADIALWQDKFKNSMSWCDSALAQKPDDETLLYKKALIASSLYRYAEAEELLKNILAKNPNHAESQKLLTNLQTEKRVNQLGVNYTLDYFNQYFKPQTWHLAHIEYLRKFRNLTVIPRLNYANRFGQDGFQGELDAFLRYNRKFQSYFNAGYSNATIFPQYRVGTSLYINLPRQYELDLGFRYLRFKNSAEALIYTVAFVKYMPTYWVSVRSFLVPQNQNLNPSFNFIFRKYLLSQDEYFTITLGIGASEFIRTVSIDGDFLAVRSARLKVDFQRKISEQSYLAPFLGYERNYANFNQFFDYRITAGLGAFIKF